MTTEERAIRASTLKRLGVAFAQVRDHHTCPCDACVQALELLARAEQMLEEMS